MLEIKSGKNLFLVFVASLALAPCLVVVDRAVGQATQTQAMPLAAEEEPSAETVPQLTKEVESRLKQLEELQDVEEETKAKARELYRRAQQALDTAAETRATIAKYNHKIESASVDMEKKKAERDGLAKGPAAVTAPPPDKPVTELEQRLDELRKIFAQYEAEYKKYEAEPNRRTARLAEIPKLLQAAEQQLVQLERDMAAPDPSGEPSALALPRETYQRAQRLQLELLTESLKKEQEMFKATDEQVPIQRDIWAKKLTDAKAELARWQELVNNRRVEAAKKQAHLAARQAAEEAPPAVKAIAKENKDLAERRAELAGKITPLTAELDAIQTQHKSLLTEFDRTKDMVEAVGLSDSAGILLRQEGGALPNMRDHRRNMAQRQPLLGELTRCIFDLIHQRSDLATLDSLVEDKAAIDDEDPSEELKQKIRAQLETKKDYLDDLKDTYESYQKDLLILHSAEQQLIDLTQEYRHFIDERVFWIRSTTALSYEDFLPGSDGLAPGVDAAKWLASYDRWLLMVMDLVKDEFGIDTRRRELGNRWVWWLLFLAGFSPLLFFQRFFRRRISTIGETAQRNTFSRFAPTLEVLLLTVLIAIVWPSLIWFVSWRLGGSVFASDFARAVSLALAAAATVFFLFEFLRQVTRSKGLADVHFRWHQKAVQLIRCNVRRLVIFGLPLLFITVATKVSPEDTWSTSLGRVSFIGFLVLAAVALQRILQPAKGVFQQLFAYQPSGWLFRLRYVWYPLIVASPLALAVLAAVGYYHTAQMLSAYLFETAWLIVALMLIYGMLNRWVLMSRRRLALEQAREAALKRRQANAEEQAPEGVSQAQESEEKLDLTTVSDQSRQLIRTGLLLVGLVGAWLIWDDVVPALTRFKEIELWPRYTQLSLADLLLAILALVVTYVATKNLPGLLELSVLKHLPLDAGARYAVTTLSRYVIFVLGIALAGLVLGITWSSIQWLIAAMGIGLGFGLQEIFANFVSGIILLFERPIRVGDIITLGDTSGIVTRIQMRATTITDWDRKEFIVPNKDLITGRMLNWTLSDQTNRILIPVGVAYGSDTEKGRELLLNVAADHPLILDDPAPLATFEGFGDSTLNLILRCYLPNLSQRLATVTELHTAIDKAFREAGIEIAFPQRDLHLRTVDPALHLVSGNGSATGSERHRTLTSGR